MKTNREIRLESLKRVLNGKWFGRMLIVMTIVCTVSNLANGVVDRFYRAKGIQTWGDFLIAKAQAMMAGLDYAVPSSAVAREMCGSTAFQMFIAFIFGGIVVYGMTSVVLKAAKETGCIVTTEEANVMGGLGAAVAEYLSETCPVPVVRHGVNDEFGRSGKAPLVLEAYGITAEKIAELAKKAISLKK